MTREELLRDAGYQITEAISVADLDQDKFRRMTGHHALVAIACVLLARELREGEVSQQVEAEAEQMVAAQYRDELAAAKARIAELEGILREFDKVLAFDEQLDDAEVFDPVETSGGLESWRDLLSRANVALGREPVVYDEDDE